MSPVKASLFFASFCLVITGLWLSIPRAKSAEKDNPSSPSFSQMIEEVQKGNSSKASALAQTLGRGKEVYRGKDEIGKILRAALQSKYLQPYYHGKLDCIEVGCLLPGQKSLDLGFGKVPIVQRKKNFVVKAKSFSKKRILQVALLLSVKKVAVVAVELEAEGLAGTIVVHKKGGKWKSLGASVAEK